jgi:hypothetical protein
VSHLGFLQIIRLREIFERLLRKRIVILGIAVLDSERVSRGASTVRSRSNHTHVSDGDWRSPWNAPISPETGRNARVSVSRRLKEIWERVIFYPLGSLAAVFGQQV